MLTTAERVRTRPGHVTAALWAFAWIALGAHLILGAAYGPARPARPTVAPASLNRAASLPATASPPAAADRARPIQDVRVGDRVLTRAPEPEPGQNATPGVLPASEPSVDAEEVDPATWRRVDLAMPGGPGGDLEIVLLRPYWWVVAAGARAGGAIDLDLPEMGAVGVARVIGVAPCLPLKPGRGRVVTGTYTHSGATVLDVGVEGLGEPVGATPMHPFYSADRRRYVAAKDLAAGERLLTAGGEARVASVARRPGGHRVYNLEVHGDHVYRVSTLGVLVHNTSPAGGRMTPDQQALKELADEASLGGRRPLSGSDANTLLDWGGEVCYPGLRASPADLAPTGNHWVGGPHINFPGVGSGHIPVGSGVIPR